MEVEAEVCALIAEETHELITGNGFDVVTGVADGGAEQDAVLLEQIHGAHNGSIVALTTAGIVGLRGTLDGQHKGDVAQTDDFLAERFIDQGGVGIDGKLHIVVLLGQLEDISLAHQRLTAGQHVQINAQFLALGDDLIHIVKAQVVLVAVLTGQQPTQCILQAEVGSNRDQPGNVAVILDTILADGLGAAEEGLIAQIQAVVRATFGIQLVQHTVDELRPLAVGVGQGLLGVCVGLLAEGIAVELL